MADRQVNPPAGSTGGKFKASPRIVAIHDLEAPPKKGMAYSLATGWLQNERVSIHAIADPGEVVTMVPLDTVAYHCGSGNPVSLGIEHTGYAAFSPEQWVAGDSKQGQAPGAFDALRNGARIVAEWCLKYNIPRRWLTPQEAAAGGRGLATHNTMRLAFGGTTHTDPGPNFPYAIYLKMVQQFAGDILDPDADPDKTEGPQVGGADPEDWFDDMARTDQDIRDIVTQQTTTVVEKELDQFWSRVEPLIRDIVAQGLSLELDRRARATEGKAV